MKNNLIYLYSTYYCFYCGHTLEVVELLPCNQHLVAKNCYGHDLKARPEQFDCLHCSLKILTPEKSTMYIFLYSTQLWECSSVKFKGGYRGYSCE